MRFSLTKVLTYCEAFVALQLDFPMVISTLGRDNSTLILGGNKFFHVISDCFRIGKISTQKNFRIFHSCSENEGLPWHRVVNRKGTISLKPGAGYEKQKKLLEADGPPSSGQPEKNSSFSKAGHTK